MPLDPLVAQLLITLERAQPAPYSTLTPPEAREAYERVVAARRGPGYVPEPVASVTPYAVPGPGPDVPVRVYRPTGEPGLPAIVFCHGGGWVVGSLETHDGICRTLANATGAVVVSVGYRLAPEHPFPAGLSDAYAVLNWVAGRRQLDIDPGRIAVAGDSAGGNLATALCLLARERRGPAIAAQALVYPAVDLTLSSASVVQNGEGYGLTAADMRWYVAQYLAAGTPPTDPTASPIHAPDLAGLPPAVVVTAEFDPLRDEGEAYAARLREAGVPVELRRYDGQVHGFLAMAGAVPRAAAATAETWSLLRGQLVSG